jgi:probable phosphoglycerate mutase
MTLNQGSGTTVWMIRHGQSMANAGRESTDPATIPLSPTGERQAAHVARVFDHGPGLILTSPFLRARQTAQATIDRFPSVRIEEWPVQEFTYLGRLHGRPTTGAERRPWVDSYWSSADPSYQDDDRSESFVDVHNRARQFLTRLSRQDAGPVAVFTHGLFTRIVLWTIMTGETTPDSDNMRRFLTFRTAYAIPNCSITELHLHPEQGIRILGAATSHIPPGLHTGTRE